MTAIDSAIQRVPATTPAADILAIVADAGGVIIEGLLTPDQVARFNSEVDPGLSALAPGGTHPNALVKEFHGANTKRLTNLVSRSEVFRDEIIDLDLVHELCEAAFLEESGTFWMTTAQVIEIGPGNRPQMLHRDLENWFPFVGMGPSGPEITLNFLIALTDFTEENGATRVIPGSNHWPDFQDRGTPEQTIPAVMNAGDALFISGKTAHGGGENRTADEYRRAVSFAFNPGYLVGEEAYPFLVDRAVAAKLPSRVQRILGFASQYPTGSPGLWMVDYGELADHLALQSEE